MPPFLQSSCNPLQPHPNAIVPISQFGDVDLQDLEDVMPFVVATYSSEAEVHMLMQFLERNRHYVSKTVNLLDQIVARATDLPIHVDIRNSIFRSLKRLCEKNDCLPSSCILETDSIRQSTDPDAYGGSSDVYHGYYNGVEVAIKRCRFTNPHNWPKARRQFFAEAVIWRHLIHPNVARFFGACESDRGQMTLVSEWLPNGDLMRYLENEPMADRIILILGIANGLQYLHENQIVHGDLKPQNILVDRHGSPCLIDFGLATVIHNTTTVNTMTTRWDRGYTVSFTAPEVFGATDPEGSVTNRTYSSDIYALAMVIWTIFSKKMPFSTMNEMAVIHRVVFLQERPERPENTFHLGLSDEFWDLITKCWHQDPTKRPPVYTLINLLTRPPVRQRNMTTASLGEDIVINETTSTNPHHPHERSQNGWPRKQRTRPTRLGPEIWTPIEAQALSNSRDGISREDNQSVGTLNRVVRGRRQSKSPGGQQREQRTRQTRFGPELPSPSAPTLRTRPTRFGPEPQSATASVLSELLDPSVEVASLASFRTDVGDSYEAQAPETFGAANRLDKLTRTTESYRYQM